MMRNPTEHNEEAARAWYQAAARTTIIAGVLAAVVCLLLVASQVRERFSDPLTSPRLLAMKEQLVQHPNDEPLKEEIRAYDLHLRQTYVRQIAFTRFGAYLLLGGLAVFLLALKFARQFHRKLPKPDAPGEEDGDAMRAAVRARLAVGVLGIVLAAGLATTGVISHLGAPRSTVGQGGVPAPEGGEVALAPLPSAGTGESAASATATVSMIDTDGDDDSAPEGETPATPEEPAAPRVVAPHERWPVFRGARAGIGPAGQYPVRWDGAKGQNIVWKTAVPLPGHNSPIVWGDRVFLSGADGARRAVFCFDAATGKLLWQRPVASTERRPQVMEDTGYAAPTMATDGTRVFAIFATGDIACFDFEGKALWTYAMGLPDNSYGHASSLVVHGNLLIVQYDQSYSADDGLSELVALDTATGKMRWQTAREVPASWSSPILIDTGKGSELITCAGSWVIAYNPATGKEVWRAETLHGEIGPSPAFAAGMVFACNTGATLSAIRPGGRGDVTKSHVAWSAYDGMPDIVSPLATPDFVLLVETYGNLTCYDLKGKKLWERTEDTSFNASPIAVGKRVYLTDTRGVTVIFEAGGAYKEVAKAPLGEAVHATPAFAGGRIYLRGTKHLYCIGG